MAKLPEEILSNIFNLERQLLESINEATEVEFIILEQVGETQDTIDYFEQLQNAKERADSYYLRLFTALRQIYPSQPIASRDRLELLYRFIIEADATVNAVRATISEIRKDFDIS